MGNIYPCVLRLSDVERARDGSRAQAHNMSTAFRVLIIAHSRTHAWDPLSNYTSWRSLQSPSILVDSTTPGCMSPPNVGLPGTV
eukprot:scaffold32059_cov16-Prasinocladus_malaysianus.AAC.2